MLLNRANDGGEHGTEFIAVYNSEPTRTLQAMSQKPKVGATMLILRSPALAC